MSGSALAAGPGNWCCQNPQASAKRLTIYSQTRSEKIVREFSTDFSQTHGSPRVALAALHRIRIDQSLDARRRELMANRDMRRLNHEHIFSLPLAAPDAGRLDALEPGLARAAMTLASDEAYRECVSQLGGRYLTDGPCLVHGDFFPGSWLKADRVRVIDAEFSFPGDAEFDLGCAIAHMALARQSREAAGTLLQVYDTARQSERADRGLMSRYAAAEVMRRLIGVAQLPIAASQRWRRNLLARSREAMMDMNWEALWA